MRHNYSGRKLKRTASHRRALLANLATSLFEHKRLVTTVAKAKELRPFAEHLITRARNAYAAEKNSTITGTDVHNRRMVGRFIRNKAVLQELFDTIAPLVLERSGGYTRITKIGLRRGDSSAGAVIELVDWSNPQDGRITSRTRRKPQTTKPRIETDSAVKEVKASKTDKPTPVVNEAPAADEEPIVDESAVTEPSTTEDAATDEGEEKDKA
jgi:large subunit ribosomal protein L17